MVMQHFLLFVVIETNKLSLFQEQGDARHDKRLENKHNFFIFTIARSQDYNFVVQLALFLSSCYFLILLLFWTCTAPSV
jgi:hypothetical protein